MVALGGLTILSANFSNSTRYGLTNLSTASAVSPEPARAARTRWSGRCDANRGPVTADDLELALQDPEGQVHVLFEVGRRPEDVVYGQAVARLEAWSPRLWLRLDGVRLDAWSRYGAELAPPDGWHAVIASAGAPILLLVLASTHRDGFLREAATRALAARDESLAGAALAVRAFDHVPQVRDAARDALLARPPERDA